MAVNPISVSEKWRTRGNEDYQRYVNSTNLQGQKTFLKKSISSYRLAYETAINHTEWASSAKNYGTAAYRLGNLLKCLNMKNKDVMLEAVTYLSKALSHGSMANMSAVWISNLKSMYSSCTAIVIEDLTAEDTDQEKLIEGLEQLIACMWEDSEKLTCFVLLTEAAYNASVKLVAEKDFKEALRLLNYCHRPAEECRRLASVFGQTFIESESSLRIQELQSLLTAAESLKDLDSGDRTLRDSINNEEELNMDLVFDAIDFYRSVAGRSREVEVELEAIAMSKLGNLYNKVLRMKWRAQDYYTQSIQLAISMHPRVFTEDDWFKEATLVLNTYKEESLQATSQKKDEERAKCREELAKDFKELEQSDIGKNPIEFLRFLYERYPPMNPRHTLTSSDCRSKKEQKKAITVALLHYHPDKQNEEMHGIAWIVFCTEVTKRLNERFLQYKFLTECDEVENEADN